MRAGRTWPIRGCGWGESSRCAASGVGLAPAWDRRSWRVVQAEAPAGTGRGCCQPGSGQQPQPAERYELAWWKKARVNIDYHISLDEHLYSVPYQLVGKQVEVRATTTCVEVFLGGRRVASHPRASGPWPTTLPEHMPSLHRAHAQWTPSRILEWAATVGPSTAALAEELMRRRKYPEQGLRACLSIIRLKEKYGPERLERACAQALRHRACTYGSVSAILRNKLEAVEPVAEERAALPVYENIRGPDYYH
ncbi:transposase [Archangium violaceum]|uniref:transposase n=1 Tax=Archangium violaceum TaxID=83451 RepID=UPI00193C2114|nr:transposase [Archangium violaceum]QRK05705.1 transposase [Archangium violaceum]